ncbi:MAG: hypothetical protein Ct9H300mP1_00340 [Planctomycetaceae bacterium]|nr:MAG: hypothetical protein Ct9H300mP1_00340 [Planctomycetaceae bacterium]
MRTCPNRDNGNGHGVSSKSRARPPTFDSQFCPAETDPFDTVEWESRTASIKDENGGVLFEQTVARSPGDWSPLGTNVVVSKYFYGEPNTSERETSVRQVIHRVARTMPTGASGRLLCQ